MSNLRKLTLRADAYPEIGSGHVMRLLAVGEAWREAGGVVGYAGRCENHVVQERVMALCNAGWVLESPTGEPVKVMHADYFGYDRISHWCALDSYAWGPARAHKEREAHKGLLGKRDANEPGYEWAKTFSMPGYLVIDDNAHAEHYDPDWLVNYNSHSGTAMYLGRVAPHTKLLLGPKYALIRREFRDVRPSHRWIPTRAKKVLLAWGGVVSDEVGRQMANIEGALRASPSLDIKTPADFGGKMAAAMMWADLYLGAAGVSVYECCCLGLPMLLVSTADNQKASAVAMAQRGAAQYLCHIGGLSPDDVLLHVLELLGKVTKRLAMSESGMALVDGKGSERVVQAMLGEAG